jgi:SNF2 family DNA or RNA helicase
LLLEKDLETWLLDPGPDLVVADEAHAITKETSKITKLLNQVKTGSRIATTGSPLSNHLEEYWAMMNWIHPGFLGTLRQFTGQYILPIKDGLYADSDREQRRTSQSRLLKLKRVLDDKLHRMDLSAIQADLPSKTEFVIYVPLTPLQRKLYEALVNGEQWKSYRNLFKWVNILRLICNHPYTLMVTTVA